MKKQVIFCVTLNNTHSTGPEDVGSITVMELSSLLCCGSKNVGCGDTADTNKAKHIDTTDRVAGDIWWDKK